VRIEIANAHDRPAIEKIPAHARERNVMPNNSCTANIGA
jgi:hypothetical protein